LSVASYAVPRAGELVQGIGDRAGRPGEHLADLVRGEGRVRELAQVRLDQVAQPAGPGDRGMSAAGALANVAFE
jgi:hypothetical protein